MSKGNGAKRGVEFELKTSDGFDRLVVQGHEYVLPKGKQTIEEIVEHLNKQGPHTFFKTGDAGLSFHPIKLGTSEVGAKQ